MLSPSQILTSYEKDNVIIQPDDKTNVIIHQMITPNEKEFVIILSDDKIHLSSSQMITSIVSFCEMIYLILSQPNHNFDKKENVIQPDDNIYVIIRSDNNIYVITQQTYMAMLSTSLLNNTM
jgi:hypothetical protein